MAKSLLSDLVERGHDSERARLFAIDGAKALTSAIRIRGTGRGGGPRNPTGASDFEIRAFVAGDRIGNEAPGLPRRLFAILGECRVGDDARPRSRAVAVTLIQRFGSAANLNIHLHCLVLDGVYRHGADGVPEFVEVPAPTAEALQTVLHKIISRMMKLLTRRGVLVEEEGSTYVADTDGDSDEARALRPLQAAARTYRIALGPRAGQEVLTVQGVMPRDADFKQTLCAGMQGFSLHAAVRCGADDRQGLEQLCRYITRPALANERVQTNAAGQVVVKLKTPWRDGTTHLVMSPLEFVQLPIEWPVCGDQIHWLYVCSGSLADRRNSRS